MHSLGPIQEDQNRFRFIRSIDPSPDQYYSSLNTQTYADKLWHEGRVPYMLEEGMSAS